MIILGIETSCDETAAAIVQDGRQILSSVVVSQIDIFKAYGGVIPEVAARSHLEAMLPVIHQAFAEAGFTTPDGQDDWDKIDAIAVTHTPGLLGSLLIGTLTARTLAILHDKPLYPTHHLKSHIYSVWLEESLVPDFPVLALVVSGGHTQIIHMPTHNQFQIIGTTRDDAVGECYDKVAKILGLPYPGGPSIAAAARGGDPHKYRFPHPKLTATARPGNTSANQTYDFSFSGLKTAVLRAIQQEVGKPISFPSHQLAPLLTQQQVADFAASFQQTTVDILLENLAKAAQHYPCKSIVIAGGVSANELLRKETFRVFQETQATAARDAQHPGAKGSPEKPLNVFFPTKSLTGDNAAMVASAAYFEATSGVPPTDPFAVTLEPRSAIA